MSRGTSVRTFLWSAVSFVLILCAWSPAAQEGLRGGGPDLVTLSVDSAGVAGDWQTLVIGGTVQVDVENVGFSGAAGSFDVTVFEDTNGNGAYDVVGDVLLGGAVVPGLASGAQVSLIIAVAGTVTFRENLLHAHADSGDVIPEDDESNNTSHSGLRCQFQPPIGSINPVLEWSWTSSLIEPNALNVMMTPGVVDLTSDGVPDVVFGSTASTGGGLVEVGFLRALNGDDGSEIFTVNDPSLRISTTCSVAVGDIDGDGLVEILAAKDNNSQIIAFENDGTLKWLSDSVESISWGGISIADLLGDGTPEIILGRQVLDNSGALLWTGSGGRGSAGTTGALSSVADVNLDGFPDVVAGNTVYNADGSIQLATGLPDGHGAVANFDADPFPEIVLVSGGRVWVYNHDGSILWGPVSIPGGGTGGPPTVADYDNDGQPEVGVAGASRYAVFETDGTLKWQTVTQDGSSNRTGSSVFDFDGDDSAEVVYRDELKLRIYRGTDGATLFEVAMSSCTWHEYVLVADVDADGNAEIVAVANNNCNFGPQRGVFVYGSANDSWVATRRIWNQHTYHITNVNDDGTIPVVEPNNWQFPPADPYNNYRQNLLGGGLDPTSAPDLTASLLQASPPFIPDTVSIRIGNGGSVIVGAGIPVSFYDADPGSGGVLLGTTFTSTALEPGEYDDVSLTVGSPLPAMVYAMADDVGDGTGIENECNETNNLHGAVPPMGGQDTFLDIKPRDCPNYLRKSSSSVFKVTLVGHPGFDAQDVDPTTLVLSRADGMGGSVRPIDDPNGLHPRLDDLATPFNGQLCDCHRLGSDGIEDLLMDFEGGHVVRQLELFTLPAYTEVELVLTGMLFDGSSFEARDCLTVLPWQSSR